MRSAPTLRTRGLSRISVSWRVAQEEAGGHTKILWQERDANDVEDQREDLRDHHVDVPG